MYPNASADVKISIFFFFLRKMGGWGCGSQNRPLLHAIGNCIPRIPVRKNNSDTYEVMIINILSQVSWLQSTFHWTTLYFKGTVQLLLYRNSAIGYCGSHDSHTFYFVSAEAAVYTQLQFHLVTSKMRTKSKDLLYKAKIQYVQISNIIGASI